MCRQWSKYWCGSWHFAVCHSKKIDVFAPIPACRYRIEMSNEQGSDFTLFSHGLLSLRGLLEEFKSICFLYERWMSLRGSPCGKFTIREIHDFPLFSMTCKSESYRLANTCFSKLNVSIDPDSLHQPLLLTLITSLSFSVIPARTSASSAASVC